MEKKITHHLVYGTLLDYLTGQELQDTDDERIRQRLMRWLVESKNYLKSDLEPRLFIETMFSDTFVRSTIDVTISLEGKQFLIIRFGAGSLVSRERSAIAAARILNPSYRIPLAVVTNGKDAELLDTSTGKIIAYGLECIPERKDAEQRLSQLSFLPPPEPDHREKELRILNAFDLERCCIH